MIRQHLPERKDLPSAEAIEEAYLIDRRPHLRVNFVISLDGAVEVGGRSGRLGGPPDRAVFMAMRAVSDVILVGAGTARAENYGPVRLDPDVQARRQARAQAPTPPLALVTASGDLATDARVFESGQEVIIFTTEATAELRKDLASVAEVYVAGDEAVDPFEVVSELHRRGLSRILCEGGPSLTGTLLEAGVVDELCLTLSPLLAGDDHHQLSQGWAADLLQLELLSLAEGDGMLLTRYAVTFG